MSFHSEDCVNYVERGNAFVTRWLTLSQSTLRTFSTCKWQMAPLWRNASIRSSIAWGPRCAMSSGSNMMRKPAVSQNNVMGVTVATAREATSIIVTNTSGRIAITVVIVITMTSMRRNRITKFLLIAATRHSSHALHMDKRASILSRSDTRASIIKTSMKPMTKSVNTRRITTTHVTQVMAMNHALVSTRRSQVKTQHQPCWARAKIMRMRTIIFMLIRNWRQVATCLASLTIHSMGADPSQVKRVKKEMRLLYSWTMISILQPS